MQPFTSCSAEVYPKIWNPENEFPREKAETALGKFGINKDAIQPLGKCGYTAVLDNIRFIFQGAMEKDGEVYAQAAPVHNHDKEEFNKVMWGAGHFITWINGEEHHQFLKAGDSIRIPALVPHCVVAAVFDSPEEKQYGLVISRENQNNPQQFPENLPKFPEVFLNT
jgi:mannose-6-phosphate isomerase-like protein (cupin superfamily)